MKLRIVLFSVIFVMASCRSTNNKNLISANNVVDFSFREKEAKVLIDKFVYWHNRFFSAGNTEPVSKEVLSDFFADDLYFEFNGRSITNDIDGMLKGYERIKAKDKAVIIEPFQDVKFLFPNDEIAEVIIKHDTASIEKDQAKKVSKTRTSLKIREIGNFLGF